MLLFIYRIFPIKRPGCLLNSLDFRGGGALFRTNISRKKLHRMFPVLNN